jgi:hypothetical protein
VVAAMPTREGFGDEVANVKERRRKISVIADDQSSAPCTSVSVCIEDLLSRTDCSRGVSVLRYVEVLNSCPVVSPDLFLSYFHSSSKLTIPVMVRSAC